MEFKFNVTGARRKELVMAIGEILDIPPEYKGAPTFAYVIGDFTVNKERSICFDEKTDNIEITVERLLDGLDQRGFQFETPDKQYGEPAEGGYAADVPAPDEAEAWAKREMRRMNLENQKVPDYSNRGPYGGDDVSNILTIEMPLDGFTETALENLDRLIASKAALIKKAIGADSLPIERTGTTLGFPWFRFGIKPEEVNAYARFIGALCATAKTQQRITATERRVDNEKYAFRCFLLRLGFIGPEYKEERKILLSKLTGSAAFKNGQRNPEEVPEA
ncbi:MAG: virulence protein [Syntrophomonadaceae bacterium]|nr:virulence protein [Syntrophomonadaceae bacterium]